MAFRRFCEAAVARRPIVIFGDGRQTRDFTYVADVIAATRAAAAADAAGGAVLSVGGGSRVSLTGALERLSAVAGRPLDVRPPAARGRRRPAHRRRPRPRARAPRLRAVHHPRRRPGGRVRVDARPPAGRAVIVG
jgi:nucleoside-diphosphate-sugar epimerase